MSKMKQFLLAFDHGEQRLVVQREFGDNVEEAAEFYRELEVQYRDNLRMDIVLVGSDSLESVKVTHSNYFEGAGRSSIENVLDRVLGE